MYAELYSGNTKFGTAVLAVFTMSFHPPAALLFPAYARARAAEETRILPAAVAFLLQDSPTRLSPLRVRRRNTRDPN